MSSPSMSPRSGSRRKLVQRRGEPVAASEPPSKTEIENAGVGAWFLNALGLSSFFSTPAVTIEEHPDAGEDITTKADVVAFNRSLTLKRQSVEQLPSPGSYDDESSDEDDDDDDEAGYHTPTGGSWEVMIETNNNGAKEALADSSGDDGSPKMTSPDVGSVMLQATPLLTPLGTRVKPIKDMDAQAMSLERNRGASLREQITNELNRMEDDTIEQQRRESDVSTLSAVTAVASTTQIPGPEVATSPDAAMLTGTRKPLSRRRRGVSDHDSESKSGATPASSRRQLKTRRESKKEKSERNVLGNKNPLGNVLEWANTIHRNSFVEVFRKANKSSKGDIRSDDEATSIETLSRQGSENSLQPTLTASMILSLNCPEVICGDERMEGMRRESSLTQFWLKMRPLQPVEERKQLPAKHEKGFSISISGASIGVARDAVDVDIATELSVSALGLRGDGEPPPAAYEICTLKKIHAYLEFEAQMSAFFLIPNPPEDPEDFPRVAFRIEPEREHAWVLNVGSVFGVGKTIFRVIRCEGNRVLVLRAVAGPLEGQTFEIKEKATIGRSQQCGISITDDIELSRVHCEVAPSVNLRSPKAGEKPELEPAFSLTDRTSTNGTFLYLAGPALGPRRVNLADQIIIDNTGFTVERFEFGVAEEKGRRRTMEDRSVIVQDLCVPGLDVVDLSPPTFAGVFDGHGGAAASMWLKDHLHNFLSFRLREAVPNLIAARQVEFSEQESDDYGSRRATLCSEPDDYFDKTTEVIVNLMKDAYLEADKALVDHLKQNVGWDATDGSTGVTAMICGNRLFIANVGDSRALLCRNGGLVLATRDHKASDEHEKERVLKTGGVVINGRVMGQLAVSRAFGDIEFKGSAWNSEEMTRSASRSDARHDKNKKKKDKGTPLADELPQLINAEPDVFMTDLTHEDSFILLATDGLFDEMSNEEVCRKVIQHLGQHGDPQQTCQYLANEAIHEKGSMDNVTVMIIVLNRWWRDISETQASFTL